MNFKTIRKLIANPNDNNIYSNTYCICNEFGILAIAYADCEQEALDEATDSGHLNSARMSSDDYDEAIQRGYDDSYILAGNASEPLWSHYLTIKEVARGY